MKVVEFHMRKCNNTYGIVFRAVNEKIRLFNLFFLLLNIKKKKKEKLLLHNRLICRATFVFLLLSDATRVSATREFRRFWSLHTHFIGVEKRCNNNINITRYFENPSFFLTAEMSMRFLVSQIIVNTVKTWSIDGTRNCY